MTRRGRSRPVARGALALASPADHAGPSPPQATGSPWLFALLVLVTYAGVFRLGFFADDFIFLDAARRQPLLQVVLGWHGVWPWYRPLARELLFAAVDRAGPLAAPLAHVLSLTCLWVAATALQRVLALRIGAKAAAVGAVLFVCHALTSFLTGWGSGFQDLLAVTLALTALRLQQDGRVGAAALCAGLAPFAKETGFLAFLLLALDTTLGARRRPSRREWSWWCSAAALAVTIHVLVRTTWPHRLVAPTSIEDLRHILPAFGFALVPWTLPPGPAPWTAWVSAVLAVLLVRALLRAATRAGAPGSSPALTLVFAALLLSLVPALVPALITHTNLQPHFLFAALPWVCALAGWALVRFVPAAALNVALPLACGALVWTAAPRPVDLGVADGWRVGRLGWAEAQRIEARTRRLERDARELLAMRPESLTVGFLGLPIGSWFQTGDGPALRIVLGDPTVRARLVEDLPARVFDDPRAPMVVLDYDPDQRHGLVLLPPDAPVLMGLACEALLEGRSRSARALARYAARADSLDAFPAYLVAAATLDEGGAPREFATNLAAAGAGATSGAIASTDPRSSRAIDIALASPGSPDAHRQAADSLARAPLLEALELFIAIRLDTTRADDALRLGRLLGSRAPDGARRAYAWASAPGAPPGIARAARAEAAALERGRTP